MTEITLPLLQELLREDYPDVEIQDFEDSPGSKRGDNYTSMVFRITLKGIRTIKNTSDISDDAQEITPWEGSIIYKRLPENASMREAFKSDELFCNEVAFYTKIWPAMIEFQSIRKVSSPFKTIPKCYLAKNDCVILRDLNMYGFVMADRRKGLTVAECYVVLKNLAQFHALSLAMKFHDPEGFFELVNEKDSINEVYYAEKNIDYYRSYFNEAMQNATMMIEEELKDSENRDMYLEKFQQFCTEESFFIKMVDVVKPREPIAVINHGDCWTNNIMFRYVDGDIAEMCFVDFQQVRYASPALDLVYLVYLCLDRQQRKEHLDSLLQYYTDELHRRLENTDEPEGLQRKHLGELIREEFRRCSPFGLGNALDMCPIMTCDSDEAPNLYQSVDASGSPNHVQPVSTANAACRKKLADLVQELVDAEII